MVSRPPSGKGRSIMTHRASVAAHDTAAVELTGLRDSYARHLRAANLSPMTIKAYLDAVDRLIGYLAALGPLPSAPVINRDHIQAFIVDQLERWKPATAGTRLRNLQQLFKWLVDEEEIFASPMPLM